MRVKEGKGREGSDGSGTLAMLVFQVLYHKRVQCSMFSPSGARLQKKACVRRKMWMDWGVNILH